MFGDYFEKKLTNSADVPAINRLTRTAEKNGEVLRDFSELEALKAVLELSAKKAPGPDGLGIEIP